MKDKCLAFSKFPWTSQMIMENRTHGHPHRYGETFCEISGQFKRVGRIVCAMIEYASAQQGSTYWQDIEYSTNDIFV